MEKINDPFEILNKLASIGKKRKTIEITGISLVLETLGAEDEAKVFALCNDAEGSEFFSRNKREMLIHSIVEIGEKSLREYEKIENLIERNNIKQETLGKIRSIVNGWQDEFITYLYTKFSELVAESEEEMIKLGVLKNMELPETEEKKE
jgi:hypothetical protein